MIVWVFNEHGFRLTSWNQPFLTPACLQEYVSAITRQGSPLTNCCDFTDSTVGPMCRSREKQSVVYNGHKRVPWLKFYSTAKWFDSKSLWSGQRVHTTMQGCSKTLACCKHIKSKGGGPMSLWRPGLPTSYRVRQTQTADWQVNEVNIVVKCFNRFPIPKIDS